MYYISARSRCGLVVSTNNSDFEIMPVDEAHTFWKSREIFGQKGVWFLKLLKKTFRASIST